MRTRTRFLTALAIAGALTAVPVAAYATPLTVPDDYCTTTYTTVNHAAVGEPTIPNPGYVPAVDAVSEVSVTEYLYVQQATEKEKWQDSPDWNPGKGWTYTGTTRSTILTPGTPGTPAVGEPTIPNPEYVAAYDTEEPTGEWCEGWFTSLTTYLNANPQGADDVSWPQTIIGAGKLAPECGTQVQQDYWAGTREQINAILADGQLTRPGGTPEDSQVVRDWEFADGGECPPVVPEKPTPRPWSDQRDDFTCDIVTEYRAEGYYDWTLVANTWVENADPTVTTSTTTPRATTLEERLGRNCDQPPTEEPPVVVPPVEPPVVTPTPVPPVLAETGASPATGLFGLAGALAIALGVLFATFGAVHRKVTNR